MPQYQARGQLPQKRFTVFPNPKGGIYYEHIFTAEGFAAEDSILYRLSSPTRILRSETKKIDRNTNVEIGGTQNSMFMVNRIMAGGDFIGCRQEMLVSDQVKFSMAKPDRAMTEFYRNGWCDELVVVIEGSGTVRSMFGEIRYEALDMIYIPRGDTVQWAPDAGPQLMTVIESRSPITIPKRYLKPNGQFQENSPYHERDIRAPKLVDPIDEVGEYTLNIKTGGHVTRSVVDRHPFDVVAWDGCYYPFAISMRDLEPLTGRIHLLPDQYAAFSNDETMIACITPRRMADHPEITPMQPFHQNIDFDEVLYRFGGTSGATEPSAGTFTLHPRGFDHGPKVGFEKLPRRETQDTWGLMMDTRAHLRPTTAAMAASDENYGDMYLKGRA